MDIKDVIVAYEATDTVETNAWSDLLKVLDCGTIPEILDRLEQGKHTFMSTYHDKSVRWGESQKESHITSISEVPDAVRNDLCNGIKRSSNKTRKNGNPYYFSWNTDSRGNYKYSTFLPARYQSAESVVKKALERGVTLYKGDGAPRAKSSVEKDPKYRTDNGVAEDPMALCEKGIKYLRKAFDIDPQSTIKLVQDLYNELFIKY